VEQGAVLLQHLDIMQEFGLFHNGQVQLLNRLLMPLQVHPS
jgi:hypothetical protein